MRLTGVSFVFRSQNFFLWGFTFPTSLRSAYELIKDLNFRTSGLLKITKAHFYLKFVPQKSPQNNLIHFLPIITISDEENRMWSHRQWVSFSYLFYLSQLRLSFSAVPISTVVVVIGDVSQRKMFGIIFPLSFVSYEAVSCFKSVRPCIVFSDISFFCRCSFQLILSLLKVVTTIYSLPCLT